MTNNKNSTETTWNAKDLNTEPSRDTDHIPVLPVQFKPVKGVYRLCVAIRRTAWIISILRLRD